MNVHFLFEPHKLKATQFPFSFYEKKQTGATFEVINHGFLRKIIDLKFNSVLASELALFSFENYQKHQKIILSTYKNANFSQSEEEFIKSQTIQFFQDNFRKIFTVLSEIKAFHRVQTSTNSFSTLPCSFNPNITPIFSFSAEKTDGEIQLKTIVQLGDDSFELEKTMLFEFLICFQNTYYFLKRNDWLVLQEVLKNEIIPLDEFTNKTCKTLKNYSTDFSTIFQNEERNVVPKKLLHISELGENTLMLIPSWDYDGTIVEGEKDSFEKYEGSKLIVYKRNKSFENESLDFIKQTHPSFAQKSSFYLSFEEAENKNWFLNTYQSHLKENFEISGMDMLRYFRYSQFPLVCKFDITKTIDNEVIAKVKVTFGKQNIDLRILQKALNEGRNFVSLKDQSMGVLTDDWISQYGIILRYATINEQEITFAKWILISSQSMLSSKKELQLIVPKEWFTKWNSWNQSDEILYDKPQHVDAQLRNYQQKGFEWINLMAEVNAGTLLADDMGLGKTLQTITAISYFLEKNKNAKFLIICPSSLIYNWKMEFEKFAPSLKTNIYHGSNRALTDFIASEDQILITSYSIVRNDIDEFVKLIWDGIILDESHHIKNYDALQTQAILKLNGKRRILLNGTPIMNSISDLFPQLSFMLPQLFFSLTKFRKDFENYNENGIVTSGLELLRKLTNPFILRRTKENVAPDLPQKTESILWCEMNQDQRNAYESIKNQIKNSVFLEVKDKGLGKAKLGILQGITKLRQVCSSPRLLKDETDFQEYSSTKINQLIELLTTNLKDNKVVIFTQFIGTIDLLSQEFKKNSISFLSFSGSTPTAKRMQLVSEFQDEKSTTQVFLLSLMAGNTGINLTKANYVFLVEPWWNKAVQQQAIDRTHRIGQNQHVFAYKMICKDTIEEKIIILQDKKQFISDEVISTDENFVKNLSEEDIAFLFE